MSSAAGGDSKESGGLASGRAAGMLRGWSCGCAVPLGARGAMAVSGRCSGACAATSGCDSGSSLSRRGRGVWSRMREYLLIPR
jgi:hypothetical protein